MVIFHSYVSLPEGNQSETPWIWCVLSLANNLWVSQSRVDDLWAIWNGKKRIIWYYPKLVSFDLLSLFSVLLLFQSSKMIENVSRSPQLKSIRWCSNHQVFFGSRNPPWFLGKLLYRCIFFCICIYPAIFPKLQMPWGRQKNNSQNAINDESTWVKKWPRILHPHC